MLLRLGVGRFACDALVTENELVGMCKRLGPDKLLLLLQSKIPSDDPDLQPRASNNWPYQAMVLFVLRHADDLLRPADSDALLACERFEREPQKRRLHDPTITALWAVAAARLQPAKASTILHAAMERFQGQFDANERSTICIALWQLAGEPESQYLLDWLYGEAYPHQFFPGCRSTFIDTVGKDPKGRKLIARIIQDRRFATLDWESLIKLVRVVNGWLKKPLVTEQEVQKAWPPSAKRPKRCEHSLPNGENGYGRAYPNGFPSRSCRQH